MSRRSGSLAVELARYAARSERVGECLIGPHKHYGNIRYDGGKQMTAHRASHLVHNGPIPDGMVVRHTCDTPRCIEPSHLLIGTYLDNERDKRERGRFLFGLRTPSATVAPEVIEAAVAEYLRGGQSQAAMARKLGVGSTTFGRWVRAEARLDANLKRVVVGRGSRLATGLKGCGTRAGVFMHRRRGEAVCDACREADRTYMRAYKAARKGRAA